MLEALNISISDTKFVEYEYFADKVQSSEAETNAKYKRFLKDLSKQGPDSKMAAKKAYKKFENRKLCRTEFGKRYKYYWLENFDRQSMPISSPTNDEIFDVASFSPSFSGSDRYSSDTTTVSGSSALSVTSAAALVKDFLLDIPKVLDYEFNGNTVVDFDTVQGKRRPLQVLTDVEHILNFRKAICQFPPSFQPIQKFEELKNRLLCCPANSVALRTALNEDTKFRDDYLVAIYDPHIHADWNLLNYLTMDFLRKVESFRYNLADPLVEENWLKVYPIIIKLFEQYAHRVEVKWINNLSSADDQIVGNRDKDSSIGTRVLVAQFSGIENGGQIKKNLSDQTTLLNDACMKEIERHRSKPGQGNSSARVHYLILYNNVLSFESLTQFENILVRKSHVQIDYPTDVDKIKRFVDKLSDVLTWRASVLSSS